MWDKQPPAIPFLGKASGYFQGKHPAPSRRDCVRALFCRSSPSPSLLWMVYSSFNVLLVCSAAPCTPAEGNSRCQDRPSEVHFPGDPVAGARRDSLPPGGGVWMHFPSILPAWKCLPGLLRKTRTPTHCTAPCGQQKKLTITH